MVFTGNLEARNLRLQFFGITAETCRELREFKQLVSTHMPLVVSGFYDHLKTAPALATLIGANAPRLAEAVVFHWETLLSARFDDEYFDQVRRIGRVYHSIGLEPHWYVGSYNFVLQRLIEIAERQSGWPQARVRSLTGALTSAVMLDLELAMSVYSDVLIELDHLQQEAASAKSAREQIDRLLSGLPAVVYSGVLDPGARLHDFQVRDNSERLCGLPASALKSWDSWAELAASIDARSWQQYFHDVMRTGEASIEYDFRHSSGQLIRCRDQARVVERREDGHVEIVGYVSDITRDHQIRTQAVASAKLATLGEMATGLAHEMNQPITIMSLAAENSAKMLQEKGAEGIAYSLERLSRIKNQALRARTIIDHLKIFGGKGQDTSVTFELSHAIEGALSLVGGALRAGGVVVINKVSEDLPPLRGGNVLAEHVMVNLILNARDAMSTNGADVPRQVKLYTTVNKSDGAVSLHVCDTGPGIPAAIQGRLFEPFFTTKEVGKGTGLGLSICHGIVSSFGGTIIASNAPQGGAIFTVTFQDASTVH